MNARNSKWMIAVAVAALGSTACNPYPAENTSAPRIDRVLALGSGGPLVVDSPGPFVIPDVNLGTPNPKFATSLTTTVLAGQWKGLSLVVQFNKPMDGLSIQSAPTMNADGSTNASACTPAAGLTITPAAPGGPGGPVYFTCYYPSTPDTTSGSQLVLHRGVSYSSPGSPPTGTFTPTGNDPRSSVFPGGVDYRITGTVRDLQGNPLAIDATFSVEVVKPATGPTVATGATAGSVDLSWAAVLNAASYTVQRAPNAAGAPGTYSTLATGVTALTYTDAAALATGAWYRIVATGLNGTVSAPGPASSYMVQAAPALAAAAGPSVTVTWAPATGATAFDVERAPDVAGAPGTFAAVATGLTASPYTDTTVSAATTYWYRIVATGNGATDVSPASTLAVP